MASTPDELVTTFISLLSARDLDAALVLVSPDCEYDNVPMGKTHGPDGIRAALTGFFATAEDIEWETLRQVAVGDLAHGTVLNERDDRLRLSGSWRCAACVRRVRGEERPHHAVARLLRPRDAHEGDGTGRRILSHRCDTPCIV